MGTIPLKFLTIIILEMKAIRLQHLNKGLFFQSQGKMSTFSKTRLYRRLQSLAYCSQIVGYHFSFRLTATLNPCLSYPKLLVHVL